MMLSPSISTTAGSSVINRRAEIGLSLSNTYLAKLSIVETFSAGITFARTEGHIPAPETCHAIAAVIREAERAKEEGVERTILMSWSGHGIIDLAAYDTFMAGRLEKYDLPEHEIRRALAAIEGLPPVKP